jgi:Fic family protein
VWPGYPPGNQVRDNLPLVPTGEDHVSRLQQVIDALEAERADLQERLAWLDRQINEFRERHGDERAPPPPRSMRRATARRASTRRATARQRKGDISGRIIDYLNDHPQSTAGDVAKALNANRNTTATQLSRLVKKGEIRKASKGYAVK